MLCNFPVSTDGQTHPWPTRQAPTHPGRSPWGSALPTRPRCWRSWYWSRCTPQCSCGQTDPAARDKFTPWTSHAERAALSSGSSTQHKLLSLGINRPAELVGVSDMKIIYPKPVPRVVNSQNEDFIFPCPPGSCSIQYLGIQLQKWHLPCLPCSKHD